MTESRALGVLPIAGQLSESGRKTRLDAWRNFDSDYALITEEREGTLDALAALSIR